MRTIHALAVSALALAATVHAGGVINVDADASPIVSTLSEAVPTPLLMLGCLWDLDGDGNIGITDLLDLLARWGPNPGHPADFNGDGVVGITDLLELLANWGPCP